MMLRACLILLLASLAAPLAAQTCPAGYPRVAPDSRYVVGTPDPSGHPNERVVRDIETGLEWKQCSEGQTGSACTGTALGMTWGAALIAARTATWAGHEDWRLPNIMELQSLIETGCYGPSINTMAFPGTASSDYWSSTTDMLDVLAARLVHFGVGGLSSTGKSNDQQVRLVRGGQWLDPLHTLSYSAGANGSLSGNTSQTVAHGADGTPVTAVPDAGYHFAGWSDGATANPRTDTNVQSDITVTANFAADPVIGPITWAANSATSIVYDGTAQSASASVDSGYSLSFSYDGSPTAPSDAGSYTVVASVNELPGISRSEILTIVKATQAITDFESNPAAPVFILNGTFTLSAVGGASGNPLVFGSLTPAVCTVSGNTVTMLAVGTCTLTADQAGNANYEPAAQVTLDVVLAPAPAPDLAVSIDDGRDYVQYGKPLGYTIVVSNVGNTSVTGASVSAPLPAILQGQGWSCVASTGSACGQASGSGDLVDSGAALAVGGSLTYLLDTVVVDDPQLASDEILLSAGVTASGDVNGANDSATDLTLAVLFRNGFEQGEDGAQALPPELRLGALGTLTQDLALTLAVDAATLVPWQRTTLAQAGDGAFQVEAIRVADGVYLRLRSAEQAGAWSRLDAGAIALVLADTRLGLVGTGAGLVLPHTGPFEVVYLAAR